MPFIQDQLKCADTKIYPDSQTLYQSVLSGQVDADFLDTAIVLAEAKQTGGKLEVVGQYKTGEKYGAIYPKGSANEDALDQGISTMLERRHAGQPVEDLPRSRLRWRPVVGADLDDQVVRRAMSASILVTEELQPGPTPAPPRPVTGLAALGLVLAVLATLLMVKAAMMLRDYNHDGPVSTTVGVVLVVLSLYAWVPAIRAFAGGARARRRCWPRTSSSPPGGSPPAGVRRR